MNAEAVWKLLMKISGFNKIRMLPAVASGSVMPGFALDLVGATALTILHCAVVPGAERSFHMPEATLRKGVFNSV